ncbi:O-antigen ligase family protein [Streptomyces sp. NPDC052077]|uniref:O-antigen ligase family protein n=1 Tax=Streptomyces sp. NPDC052077 TaxID=3154757 RepID=UPI00343DD90D
MSHAVPRWSAAAVRRPPPVLAVVAVVALLALPVAPGGGAHPADVVSALAVLYCAVRLARGRRRPLSRRAVAVLALPVPGLALAAAGASAGAGPAGFGRYLQVFVLVPAAVLLLVRDRRDARLTAWSLVGLALWQGALGVHQYATGTGAFYRGAPIRAVGTFGSQDVMGMATVVSLGLVCAVGLALGHAPVRRRAVAAGCALVLLLPLALSFSRGAWIATAVACAAQVLLTGARRALAVGAAAVAAGVVLVGGLGVGTAMLQERLDSITRVADAPDRSVTDRYTMWAAAVDMWRESPLTGVGLKGFPDHRDTHASLALSSGGETDGAGTGYVRQPLLSPHNMYLLVLAEQGLIGLSGLAGCWLALLALGLRRLYATGTRAEAGSDGGEAGTRPGAGGRGAAGPPDGVAPRSAAGRPAIAGAHGAGTPAGAVGAPGAGASPGAVETRGAVADHGAARGTGVTGAPRAGGTRRAEGARGADGCALTACGLLVWQLTDFAYADIGGPSTVLTAVCLGLAAHWALGPREAA